MKNFSYAIAFFVLFSSCTDLETLEPFQNGTFIKYYGDKGNTEAVDLEIVADGFVIIANNVDAANLQTILFKTDLSGNGVTSANTIELQNFIAKDLHAFPNGYLIIGDSIISSDETVMRLVKTDLNLSVLASFTLAEINSHGTGVTFNQTLDQIIAQGYIEDPTGGTPFIRAYSNTSLSEVWRVEQKRNEQVATASEIFLNTNTTEEYVSLILFEPSSLDPKMSHYEVAGGTDGTGIAPKTGDLYTDYNLAGTQGGFAKTIGTDKYASAFTISDGTSSSIGLSVFTVGENGSTIVIKPDDLNFFAHDIQGVKGSDELVILGSKGITNVDTDFYLTKVEADGTINPEDGFEVIIGGVGRETGAAVKEAADGGFVFVGTLENVNDNKVIVLVKVNSKGELVN